MQHLFLGSIGVLAETSELQRQAFNEAFLAAGLDWWWPEDLYQIMLAQSGGQMRLESFAKAHGEDVDTAAIHAKKTEIFQAKIEAGVAPRPGVSEALASARSKGMTTALVTTTSRSNVEAILAATGLAAHFDHTFDASAVTAAKPAAAIYEHALVVTGLAVEDVLAVEDNPDGFAAARSAGLTTVAMPGAFHAKAAFPGAVAVVTDLRELALSSAA